MILFTIALGFIVAAIFYGQGNRGGDELTYPQFRELFPKTTGVGENATTSGALKIISDDKKPLEIVMEPDKGRQLISGWYKKQ